MIGVVGVGVTGTRIVTQLLALGHFPIGVFDRSPIRARDLASLYNSGSYLLEVLEEDQLSKCDVVVLACAKPHIHRAESLIKSGVKVVSLSDDVHDTRAILGLHQLAGENRTVAIVGASASPGLSGLLARSAHRRFDSVDEIHVALHGTGGPDCARQHHSALSQRSIGWHDDYWLQRPAGSGRELCWFPEPVGARDCYRAAMADPILLKSAMPHLQRVTARMSATRRDRFTSRLPMMIPPHPEGGMGGVRVEIRGWRSGSRIVEILGVVERLAQIAGVVAASTVSELVAGGFREEGVFALGSPQVPNQQILRLVESAGIRIHEFVGN